MLTIGKGYPEGTKTILVSGCSDYIGANTLVELINKGHRVVAMDDFTSHGVELLKWVHNLTDESFRVFNVEMVNKSLISEVFSECSIDGVIHIEAQRPFSKDDYKPLKYYKSNLLGSLNLLEVMDIFGVNNFVFTYPHDCKASSFISNINHELCQHDKDLSYCSISYENTNGYDKENSTFTKELAQLNLEAIDKAFDSKGYRELSFKK